MKDGISVHMHADCVCGPSLIMHVRARERKRQEIDDRRLLIRIVVIGTRGGYVHPVDARCGLLRLVHYVVVYETPWRRFC